jgi:MFS family permease
MTDQSSQAFIAGPDSRTFLSRGTLAVTIGNMLEFYDFITYSFFAIQIGHTFFPSDSQFASLMLSLATFGAGFVTRPIGGIVIGSYSDRAGRRPAMILSFAMMGSAIIVLALTPSYASIGIAAPVIVIIARMVQGFSLGGEVGPTTAYLMEAAPPDRRGLAVSWQPASQEIAATFGALVGALLSRSMSDAALDSWGWRIAFLIGAACLPFGLWLRSGLPETVDLEAAAKNLKEAAGSRLGMVRANARIIILGLMVLASGTIITYVGQYMTTYAEHTLHVATELAFATSVMSNGLGIVGALGGGWLADRAGRWPVMVWPQFAALLLTYPVFLWIVDTQSAWALLGGFGFLSLVGSLPYSAFYVALAEGLPQNIRGGAFATIYAVAIATFGGTAQLIVTWLIHVTGNALAPAWYMLLATAIGLAAMAMMRETAPIRGEKNGASGK